MLISIDKRSIQRGVTVAGGAGGWRGEELTPVGLIGATATTELGQAAPTARLGLVGREVRVRGRSHQLGVDRVASTGAARVRLLSEEIRTVRLGQTEEGRAVLEYNLDLKLILMM